jgi:hypothetical protein
MVSIQWAISRQNSASYLTSTHALERGWDDNAEKHKNTADRQDAGQSTPSYHPCKGKRTLGTKTPYSTASKTRATAFREKRSTYCRRTVELNIKPRRGAGRPVAKECKKNREHIAEAPQGRVLLDTEEVPSHPKC